MAVAEVLKSRAVGLCLVVAFCLGDWCSLQHCANPELNYGNANSVNPATVEDEDPYLPITPYIINLFDWNTQYPASAMIQTTEPIAGPFDYTAYIINFKGSPTARLVVEVAVDPEAGDDGWKQLGDTINLNPTRRLYQKYVRSYEESTPAKPAAIYNLNGVRQQSMRRGLNIVRHADGTTTKVMKN